MGNLLINSIGSGAIEAGFELATRGIMKRAGIINSEYGAAAAKEFIKGGVGNMLVSFGGATVKEGTSESATELTSALWDAVSMGKKIDTKELLYTMGDAFAIGSGMGGAIDAAGGINALNPSSEKRALHALMQESDKVRINEIAKEINKVVEEAPNANPEDKALIEEQVGDLINEADKIYGKTKVLLNDLTKEELDSYVSNIEAGNDLKKSYSKLNTQSAKDKASNNFKNLQQANADILKLSQDRITEKNIQQAQEEAVDLGLQSESISDINEFIEMAATQGVSKDEAAVLDGLIIDGKFVINETRAKEAGAISVGSHELLHGIIGSSFDKLSTEEKQSLNRDFYNQLSSKQQTAVRKRLKESYEIKGEDIFTTEEMFTAFSDAIEKNEITFDESIFNKIKLSVENVLRKLSEKGFIGKESKFYRKEFSNGRQVYSFLKDYNKTFGKTGKLSKRAKEFAKVDPASIIAKKSMTAAEKATAQAEIKKLGQEGLLGDNFTQKGGKFLFDASFDDIYNKIKSEGYLDNLIAAQYKGETVPKQFVDKVYSELTSHAKRFDPEINDDFFGYLNSQIANKAGNVYNREYKADQITRAQEIGERTEEGEVKIQVEAETDVNIEQFEQEDLSIDARVRQRQEDAGQVNAEKQSKFRRDLGFETDGEVYNKVLSAAKKSILLAYRKTQNITDPSERGIAIRELIRKEYFTKGLTSDLFKPIKNFLGSKAYIKNLKEHREAIVNSISTADFVQMERKVDEGERIFTRFVKKLTSKEDVQDAVNKDLLPLDALNKIDKGQSVNLYAKVMPTEAAFVAFADQPAINPVTGARSGLKGTRKDGFTKAMANTLILDATMEVRQSEDVVDALEGDAAAINDVQDLAASIGREVDVKFSKTIENSTTPEFQQKLKEDQSLFNKLPITGRQKLIKGVQATLSAIPRSRYGALVDVFEDLEQAMSEGKTHQEIRKEIEEKHQSSFNGDFGFTKILAAGSFDQKHINSILNYTRRLNDTQVRSIGFSYAMDILDASLNSAGDKAQALIDWLKFFSKSSRTGKVYHNGVYITKNSQMFDAIKPLIDKYNIQGFSVKGKNTQRSSIQYNNEPVSTYLRIQDVKKDPKGSNVQMSTESSIAIDNFLTIIESNDVSPVVKKALVKLLSLDQVGGARKMGKQGLMVANFTGKTVLDHRPTMNQIRKEVFKAIDDNNYDNIRATLENSRVNLIPKEVDNILNKLEYKIDGGMEVYTHPAVVKALEGVDTYMGNSVKFSKSTKPKGMSTFDFDETLIIDGENFVTATKDGKTVKIPSDKWPIDGPRYSEEGWSFDFSDFVNVRGGVEGPLLQKMKNQIAKYGNKNVFVLTARMQDAAKPIQEWLKSKGIDIPLKNITGLGNSTGDAKAAWFLEKYEQGYNDMYFVDDALPNVEAVQYVFDQLDVKGKSVQARVKFSKTLSKEFNRMLKRTKGVNIGKTYSRIAAQKRGKNIGRFAFFVPPSADDFAGLLRYFVGKGKQGDADIAFFKEALIDPFARADEGMKRMRQTITEDYKTLRKTFPDVKKKLGDMIDDSGFTFDNAIRVYLWDKAGFDIPGLSKEDVKMLTNKVKTDQDLKNFADVVASIANQPEGYLEPGQQWQVESVASDLQNVVNKIGRKKFLGEWIENKNEIFSEENLNKIEATYGSNFREALENILWRMENGTNRAKGMGRIESAWNNWVNGSVGAIMFFNARSAVLQTLSTVNFLNFEENNIFAAAKAFADQEQYWKDFSFLFNSSFLKQRRAGLQTNINEAEIASAVAGATNKAKAAIQYILKIGFTPTQIADSFAIASGGSTYYRNRINKYTQEGMSQADAEAQAMLDFQEIAEETQQSARPDRISQQQASSLGRIILAFANTPMQYNRLIKKAAGDLLNKRGDWRSNVSRIIYYGAIQGIIFSALQNAIFALAFDDEDREQEEIDQKVQRTINGVIDSLLRGTGLAGAVVSTIKNTIMSFREESEKGFKADYGNTLVQAINLSPPIGSKVKKLYQSTKTYKFNKDIMGEMSMFDLENPIYNIVGNITSATTNLPLDRTFRKIDNMKEVFNQDNEAWQRIAVGLGWDQWSLGIDTYKEVDEAKEKVKQKEQALPRKERLKEEDKNKEAQFEKDQREEVKKAKKGEIKMEDITCSAVTSTGKRCTNKPVKNGKCTIHEAVEMRESGKKFQCRKRKSDGTRCKIMTASKSQYCYYHD